MLLDVWKGLPEDIWHWHVKAYLIDYFERFNKILSKKTLNFYLKSVSKP